MYRRTGCGAPFPSFPSRRDAAATIILPGLRAPAPAGAFAPARRVVVRILCLCALVFGVSGAVAQSAQTVPQFTLGTSAVDSVPQTTVVPVQQPPVQVVEHTTVYEESMRSMTRPERRAYRAKLYAQKIDSLVQSRDYMFFPNSMQEVPGGMIRSIYTDYYFFGMFIDHVGVHLPTERGITQYLYVLNFDSPSLSDYRAERLAWGWRISFGFADGDTPYHAGFEVSTATGETVLTLTAPDLVMRYVGWLWDKRIGDPKFRRHRFDGTGLSDAVWLYDRKVRLRCSNDPVSHGNVLSAVSDQYSVTVFWKKKHRGIVVMQQCFFFCVIFLLPVGYR